MPGPERFDPASLRRGRLLKRLNALTALTCAAVTAIPLAWQQPPSILVTFTGLIAGLLWANGFEYVYHRWLLHWPNSSSGRRHLLHHSSVGTPIEPEHVTLGGSPLWVVVLFLINGVPVALADRLLGLGFAPGMLVGLVAYLIAVEDVHWRVHIGESLPGPLAAARPFHMAHHDVPAGNFSVFLPIWDKLLRTPSRAPNGW